MTIYSDNTVSCECTHTVELGLHVLYVLWKALLVAVRCLLSNLFEGDVAWCAYSRVLQLL